MFNYSILYSVMLLDTVYKLLGKIFVLIYCIKQIKIFMNFILKIHLNPVNVLAYFLLPLYN